jgi:hypothetical protein
MGKKIVPIAASDGAATSTYQRLHTTPELRSWLLDETFTALGSATTANDITMLVEQILTATQGSAIP